MSPLTLVGLTALCGLLFLFAGMIIMGFIKEAINRRIDRLEQRIASLERAASVKSPATGRTWP